MAVAISAIATAIEVGTVASALTAVAAVGAATSVVGAITGDKGLMQIGGVLGLVGGLGGLAAGALGAGGGIFADAAATADSVGAGISGASAGDVAASSAFDAGNFPGMATDAASSGATVGTNSALNAANSGVQTYPVGTNASVPGSDLTLDGGAAPPPINPTTGLPSAPGVQQLNPITGTATPAPNAAPDPSLANYSHEGLNSQSGILGSNTVAPPVDPATPAAPLQQGGANYSNEGGNYPNGTNTANSPVNATSAAPGTPSMMDSIIGKLGDTWHAMSPNAQSELMKSVLAIPGGIQTQNNKAKELALAQQRINQTSYGSQVPRYGILNRAKG